MSYLPPIIYASSGQTLEQVVAYNQHQPDESVVQLHYLPMIPVGGTMRPCETTLGRLREEMMIRAAFPPVIVGPYG